MDNQIQTNIPHFKNPKIQQRIGIFFSWRTWKFCLRNFQFYWRLHNILEVLWCILLPKLKDWIAFLHLIGCDFNWRHNGSIIDTQFRLVLGKVVYAIWIGNLDWSFNNNLDRVPILIEFRLTPIHSHDKWIWIEVEFQILVPQAGSVSVLNISIDP